jgi:uncharacterized protein YkwD
MRVTAALVLALLVPAAPARADTASDTLQALNQARAAAGVAPLRADARLARAARGHSRDMVAHGYFAHRSPSGSDLRARVVRTGWMRRRPEWRLGETLAWGTGAFAAPQAVIDAWLHSPPHRRIVLAADLRRVGIGVVDGTPGHGPGLTYTADFGT